MEGNRPYSSMDEHTLQLHSSNGETTATDTTGEMAEAQAIGGLDNLTVQKIAWLSHADRYYFRMHLSLIPALQVFDESIGMAQNSWRPLSIPAEWRTLSSCIEPPAALKPRQLYAIGLRLWQCLRKLTESLGIGRLDLCHIYCRTICPDEIRIYHLAEFQMGGYAQSFSSQSVSERGTEGRYGETSQCKAALELLDALFHLQPSRFACGDAQNLPRRSRLSRQLEKFLQQSEPDARCWEWGEQLLQEQLDRMEQPILKSPLTSAEHLDVCISIIQQGCGHEQQARMVWQVQEQLARVLEKQGLRNRTAFVYADGELVVRDFKEYHRAYRATPFFGCAGGADRGAVAAATCQLVEACFERPHNPGNSVLVVFVYSNPTAQGEVGGPLAEYAFDWFRKLAHEGRVVGGVCTGETAGREHLADLALSVDENGRQTTTFFLNDQAEIANGLRNMVAMAQQNHPVLVP